MDVSYTFKAWETIDIFPEVYVNKQYKINLVGDVDETTIYSCTVLQGNKLERLNEIISKYAQREFIDFSTGVYNQNDKLTFKVYSSTDNFFTEILETTIYIVYDWSYVDNDSNNLSDPIVNILDYRQFLTFTTDYDYTKVINVKLEDNIIDTYSSPANYFTTYVKKLDEIIYPAEFNLDFSDDFFIYSNIPLIQGNILTINGVEYLVANTCRRYCLYYVNSRGGIDSFLVQGIDNKNDKITNYNYKQNYSFSTGLTNTQRGLINYKKDITETWELHTHYLKDYQSLKFNELITSNNIYLHDLATNQITPVIITNTTAEYKTFKNQGRQFPTYTINVQSSQNKFRF